VTVILDVALIHIGCEPCKQDLWENSHVLWMNGPNLASINCSQLLQIYIFFFRNLLIGLQEWVKKIVRMPFLLFSSITVGRQFVDSTIVWMESSQNKHMLETVDESCFLMNSETKNLTNQ
jgi:hypothetical protein